MSLTKFLTFMIKNILSLFVIFSFHYLEGTFEHAAKNPKILVLVIASETPLVYQKTYQQLQDVWKSYMHLDPEHVEAYFIKGDPDLSTPYKIIDDTVWTKTVENYRPGILNKTILSLDAFFPRLNEFDYVLRTNLSSFYVFPKLLEFIKTLPKKGCYCGLREERDNISWAFGGGFILSRDMVEMLLKNKKEFLNNSDEADDVLIGIFMEKNKIGILSAPIFNLTSIERWQKNKDLIPKDQFHFRVKNSQERFRSTEEIYIQKELVKMFYNIKLPELTPKEKIENIYTSCCAIPSDINEHLYLLKNLASESSSFSEIGVRSMVSTSGILMGLAESPFQPVSYLGIDLNYPPEEILLQAKKIAEANQISFEFLQANDMKIEIKPVDTLFIDSLHTYCHLTYELEKFSPMVNKYIALHDTSEPWGEMEDSEYSGDYSEYPIEIDRNKKGLWQAVVDFLAKHPEWRLKERYLNNHGFTILERNNNRIIEKKR